MGELMVGTCRLCPHDAERCDVRPASPLEVLDKLTELVRHGELPRAVFLEAARQLEGAERVWRCQHGRGGEKLCREVNAYEPLLHADCGWTLVIPLGIEGEET